jgi:polysaccharide pyruvyl transferase WcaK-like protein
MKVGIITFHDTTNYGATLQAYALIQTISSQDIDVEIIDYRPLVSSRYYIKRILYAYGTNSKVAKIKNIFKYSSQGLAKYLKFGDFLRCNLNLTSRKFYTKSALANYFNQNLDYDAVICGSDQIWCVDSFRGFDASFYLNFIPNNKPCRKISYAASFGNTNNLGKIESSVCQLLSQFDHISVRDSNSARLIQQTCGRSSTKVLDPTFLSNFENITNFTNPQSQPYLLIYFEGIIRPDEVEFIKTVAQKMNLAIISVWQPYDFADQNILNLDPAEWLSYFCNASYVVTSMFHGSIFAIKFAKPFTVLSRENKSAKIADLLETLQLKDRILSRVNPETVEQQFLKIDYASVESQLESLIAESKTFLLNALIT